MEEYIWNIQQAYQQEEAKSEAPSHTQERSGDLGQLVSQVNRLTLACQAMWEMVRDKTDFTEKDLAEKIQEIDLRDGVADGKLGPIAIECPRCGRNSNSKRDTCIWCGEDIERLHAFEG